LIPNIPFFHHSSIATFHFETARQNQLLPPLVAGVLNSRIPALFQQPTVIDFELKPYLLLSIIAAQKMSNPENLESGSKSSVEISC